MMAKSNESAGDSQKRPCSTPHGLDDSPAKRQRLSSSSVSLTEVSSIPDTSSDVSGDTVKDLTVNELDTNCLKCLDTASYAAGDCCHCSSHSLIQHGEKHIDESALAMENGDRSMCTDMLHLFSSPEHSLRSEADDLEKSLARDVAFIADMFPSKDVPEIHSLLRQHRHAIDRLDLVTSLLSNQQTRDPSGVQSSSHDNSRVEQLSSLAETRATTSEDHGQHLDSLLVNDPLYSDLKTLACMFPNEDRNEIYALLEANFAHENRLESVMDILSHGHLNKESQQKPDTIEDIEDTDVFYDADPLQEDLECLRIMFPDCDPNYIYERLDLIKDKPDRANLLAIQMFETKDYPKLKDLISKEEDKEKKKQVKNFTSTPHGFLQKFPEPLKTFSDVTKPTSDLYLQHARIALENELFVIKSTHIFKVLKRHNGHFYPAYRELVDLNVRTPIAQRGPLFYIRPKPKQIPMPEVADEIFYHELWFAHNELSINDYVEQQVQTRRIHVEEARKNGELFECCCCYDDECLRGDLASCPDGHLFCKTCVIRSTEAAFGEMKTKFACLAGDCRQELSLNTLQAVINPNLFSKIVRRLQEEEVLKADIPDLVSCPFCPFAVIMTDPDDRVFKCLSPECLKESCRLCKEENHIPLRCNEVEKKAETNMRTYIENRISEAVMRKCHRCGKHFIKEMGCNKMTCVCGATSCYSCKAVNINYNHFTNSQKCANDNPDAIHRRDMEAAAIQAKAEYLKSHPEATEIQLRMDVKDMIDDFKKSQKNKTNKHVHYDVNYFDNEGSDSEDDEDSDENVDNDSDENVDNDSDENVDNDSDETLGEDEESDTEDGHEVLEVTGNQNFDWVDSDSDLDEDDEDDDDDLEGGDGKVAYDPPDIRGWGLFVEEDESEDDEEDFIW